MKNFTFSIIDIVGIFIPGFILLLAILFMFSIAKGIEDLSIGVIMPFFSSNNDTLFVLIIIAFSYVLGFTIRQQSVSLLERLTEKYWKRTDDIKTYELLNEIFSDVYNNQALTNNLLKLSENDKSLSDVSSVAPYFQFAKRIAKVESDLAFMDIDRNEATIRFIAGLFIPFIFITIDGFLLPFYSGELLKFGIFLFIFGLICSAVLFASFPKRRKREIQYVHLLVIAIIEKRKSSQILK